MIKPFIPKQDPDIPDWYGFTIHYHDKTKESFEGIVNIDNNIRLLDIVTKDDVWHWVPLEAIKRIEFDKNFSKVVEFNQKQASKPIEPKIPTPIE